MDVKKKLGKILENEQEKTECCREYRYKKYKKCQTIKINYKLMFCNGGDRTFDGEKPEHKICLALGIEPVYGLGNKIQSSSLLTQVLVGNRWTDRVYNSKYERKKAK